MANEAPDFDAFIGVLRPVLDRLGNGKVYFIVDNASKDNTRELCQGLSDQDPRFVTVWAPENRNVVDAYMKGFRVAYDAGHEIIIEMDGGMSHDPRALPHVPARAQRGQRVRVRQPVLQWWVHGGQPLQTPDCFPRPARS